VKLSRRAFLALGAAGAGTLTWWRGCDYPDDFAGLRQLSARAGFVLAAVVDTMLPPEAERTPASLRGHVQAIDAYLAGLPPADVDQLALCLSAIEQSTLLFGGHAARFTRLAREARAEVLQAWASSSFELARLGFRSLTALVFLAYYRDAAAWSRIGYPGPAMPGGGGAPDVRARYDALLAPAGTRPR
jgi:hypothetical protein